MKKKRSKTTVKSEGSSTKPTTSKRKASTRKDTSSSDAPLREMNTKVRKIKGLRAFTHTPNKRSLKVYLDRITTAKDYMTEGQVYWLQHLKPVLRKAIYERIREVDPEGWLEYMRYVQRIGKYKKLQKEEYIKEAVEETRVAIAQKTWDDVGITKFRFIPVEGILNIIAMLMATGHSREEIKDFLEVDEQMIAKVDKVRLRKVTEAIPGAIIMAADRKTLRDLIKDEVDDSTAKANKIAVDRRKLILDKEPSEYSNSRPSAREELEEASQKQSDFFDVEPVEKEEPVEGKMDENSESRPTDKD